MKNKIAYIDKNSVDERMHYRYYNALAVNTALEMIEASKEEFMIGEDVKIFGVYKNTAPKLKKYNWEEIPNGKYLSRA